jgi:hypothetical protein
VVRTTFCVTLLCPLRIFPRGTPIGEGLCPLFFKGTLAPRCVPRGSKSKGKSMTAFPSLN